MVALDLFPAILSCGLSTYAQTVLAEVLMQSYGPRKRDTVYLVGSELAELTGLDRNNARRAIKELIAAGILAPDGAGFRFVKDYESWTPVNGPLGSRLGGQLLKWIKGATARLGIHKQSSKTGESTQTHDKPSDESIQTHLTTVGESTQTHDKPSDESIQTQRHIYDSATQARASEEFRELRKRQDTPACAPARETEPTIAQPGPEFTALGNLAIEMSCDLGLGGWVSNMARLGYTAAMVRYSLERGAAASNWSHSWLQGILQRVSIEGIPEPKSNGVKPSLPPKPTTYFKPLVKPPENINACGSPATPASRS